MLSGSSRESRDGVPAMGAQQSGSAGTFSRRSGWFLSYNGYLIQLRVPEPGSGVWGSGVSITRGVKVGAGVPVGVGTGVGSGVDVGSGVAVTGAKVGGSVSSGISGCGAGVSGSGAGVFPPGMGTGVSGLGVGGGVGVSAFGACVGVT